MLAPIWFDRHDPEPQQQRRALLRYALSVTANVAGEILEFGSYQGAGFRWLADQLVGTSNKHLFTFDAFRALPELARFADSSLVGRAWRRS